MRERKDGEKEWRIFENERAVSEWLHAMAHQNVGIIVHERVVTPVCVRVYVEYC
jgi:hypothetical protein